MKLGPESRRQTGDLYEDIIFQILQSFGWRVVRKNFEIDVPSDVRKSRLQGADGAFIYLDPTNKYDMGVHVESKKCKDIDYYRTELPKWLKGIDDAIYNLNLSLTKHGFRELSQSNTVEIVEGVLSVWIDAPYTQEEFEHVTREAVEKFFENRVNRDALAMIHILENLKLKQLQEVINQLWVTVGKYQLSGHFKFAYTNLGVHDALTPLYLMNQFLFVRALSKEQTKDFHLLAFNLGETSLQQMKHFQSVLIETIGASINESDGVHGFGWDLSPSEPTKNTIWDSMFRSKIASTYALQDNTITYQGFNPNYVNISQ